MRELRFEAFVLALDLVREESNPPRPAVGDGGRAQVFGDVPAGPTTMHVLELPALAGELLSAPRLWVAAAGASSGWRRAPIMLSTDAGVSYRQAGTAEAASVMGVAVSVLPAGPAETWDRHSYLDVALLNPAMWLESRPLAAVLSGANLALVGDEIIQFAEAEALAPGRFRLSMLLRGRRGTEHVMQHAAGDRFVILDPTAMLATDLSSEMLGQQLRLRPQGSGDAAAMIASMTVLGASLAPPSPVHLKARRLGNDLTVHWVRRSRTGFGWRDFMDVPLAEDGEAYLVELWQGSVRFQSLTVGKPWVEITSVPPGPLEFKVAQLGAVPGAFARLMLS